MNAIALGLALVAVVLLGACGAPRPMALPEAVHPVIAGARAVRITGASPGTTLAGCPVFPADNPWNTDSSGAPRRAGSVATIVRLAGDLHPDFGGNGADGIPFTVVPVDEPLAPARRSKWSTPARSSPAD